jgi:hypothetical protein
LIWLVGFVLYRLLMRVDNSPWEHIAGYGHHPCFVLAASKLFGRKKA